MTTEKTKKPRKNSKAKGNSFELKVSKQLGDALSPLKFIRVPGSGARVGGMNFDKFGSLFSSESLNIFVGDVVASNESEVGIKCKVSIECKSYATVENFSLLMLGSSKIFGWMLESEIDAAKTGKTPILIFKWNRTDTYVASPFLPDEVCRVVLNRDGQSPIKIGTLEECLKIKQFWME